MRVAAIAVLTLAACGGPAPGQPCTGDAICNSYTGAWFCEGGKFKLYKCNGPLGCLYNGKKVFCDAKDSPAGEECPYFFRDQAFCASLDEKRTCETSAANPDPVWVSKPCKNCREQLGKILCDP